MEQNASWRSDAKLLKELWIHQRQERYFLQLVDALIQSTDIIKAEGRVDIHGGYAHRTRVGSSAHWEPVPLELGATLNAGQARVGGLKVKKGSTHGTRVVLTLFLM